MSRDGRETVGVLFGGRSVEHEVSVITGIQAALALPDDRFVTVPVYVAKSGAWFTGEHLLDLEVFKDLDRAMQSAMAVSPVRNAGGGLDLVPVAKRRFRQDPSIHIDIALVAMHGAEGENGALQGLLEVLEVPFTGSDSAASAIGMNKWLSKTVARANGVPVLDDMLIADRAWIGSEDQWLARCEERFGFPVMVKPLRLGSSIGISRAGDRAELESALEEAFRLDAQALVEPCIENLREFNCSVLQRADGPAASVVEEPVRDPESALLSFEQKYQRDPDSGQGGGKSGENVGGMASLDRIIPANVPDEGASVLQRMAVDVTQAIGASGVTRIDFLYDADEAQFYFNEINTIPGSFSFYLWEPTGLAFEGLLVELVDGAIRDFKRRNAKVRSYETNLLAENALSGIKK